MSNYNDVFRPLIENIRHLETEGVLLECNGESKQFVRNIATISADNLFAHAVAGISMGFSHECTVYAGFAWQQERKCTLSSGKKSM